MYAETLEKTGSSIVLTQAEENEFLVDELNAYEEFRRGNKYRLPRMYARHARRSILECDPRGPYKAPVKIDLVSEEIIYWNPASHNLATVLYVAGDHPGHTFPNPNPAWSEQPESLAVRNIYLRDPERGVTMSPIAEIPFQLVGDKARQLGRDYRAALMEKNKLRAREINHTVIKEHGLVLAMMGANGPNFRVLGT